MSSRVRRFLWLVKTRMLKMRFAEENREERKTRIDFYRDRTATKIINNKTERTTAIRINLNFKPRCLCSTAFARCLLPCSIWTTVFSMLYSIWSRIVPWKRQGPCSRSTIEGEHSLGWKPEMRHLERFHWYLRSIWELHVSLCLSSRAVRRSARSIAIDLLMSTRNQRDEPFSTSMRNDWPISDRSFYLDHFDHRTGWNACRFPDQA